MMIETLDACEGLAREMEALGSMALRSGDDVDQTHVWLWQSPQALVVPRNLAVLPEFEQARAASSERGWPVHVRATGGDVTPMGPGIVTVSQVYARAAGGPVEIDAEYQRICRPIATALGEEASIGWQPGAFCDGAYNVQYRGLKFAGTAMRFRPCRNNKGRYAILSHALMLFKPPSPTIIDALNQFLCDIGQDRVIHHSAHTGLPPELPEAVFVDRLLAAFRTR